MKDNRKILAAFKDVIRLHDVEELAYPDLYNEFLKIWKEQDKLYPENPFARDREYEFGYFPRFKYKDLVFYVKTGEHSNAAIFELEDTPENRELMDALKTPRDYRGTTRARGSP